MAELKKKLHFSNASTADQECKIYTTTEETGSTLQLKLNVDSTDCYAGLVSVTDERASIARIERPDGNVYAIGTTGIPSYGKQVFTKNGTFTVPDGCTKLRITIVAGGGGGGVYGYWRGGGGAVGGNKSSGAGGASSFDDYSCSGGGGTSLSSAGSAGKPGGTSGRRGGYCLMSNTGYNVKALDGTSYNLGTISQWIYNGSTGGDGEFPYSSTNYYGRGGDANDGRCQCGSDEWAYSGGSGGYMVKTIDVAYGSTHTITVGGGGAGHDNYGGRQYSFARNGSQGIVLVEWGKGIE